MSPVPPGAPRRPKPSARGAKVPLEPGRARGILAGLLLFGFGFAVLAVAELAGVGGGRWSPVHSIGVTIGFVGAGVVAFFLQRGTVPLPDAPIWSRQGLTALATALSLPPTPVMVVVYGLIAVGIVGNLVVPFSGR